MSRKKIALAVMALALAGMSVSAAEEEKKVEIAAAVEQPVTIVNDTDKALDGLYLGEKNAWAENLLAEGTVIEAGKSVTLIPDTAADAGEEKSQDLMLASGEQRFVFRAPEWEESEYALKSGEETRLVPGGEPEDSMVPVAVTELVDGGDGMKAEVETWYAQPKTMYTLSDVNLRQTSSTEAEVVEILDLGIELSVVGECEGWVIAQRESGTGYVSTDFVTESQEEASAALAEAQAAAEAAAAEAQDGYDSGSYSEPTYDSSQSYDPAPAQAPAQEPQAVYEVSRQNFDDCDGSGHGYAIITYSDGSTATVEY